MRSLLIGAALLTSLASGDIQKAKAFEVNCDSPVWRNNIGCQGSKKREKPSIVRPSNDDLGGADLTGPEGGTTTGNTYDAWCGPKYQDCKVSFKDDRLSVNEGAGIKREQFVRVTRERVCRNYALGLPNCYRHQMNKEYTITYRSGSGQERSALITFRHERTYKNFNRDFQIWLGDVLRTVGPSLKLDL